MKIKFYNAGIVILLIITCNKINAQTANTKLSNLTSPTSINQSLLVDKDNTHNIGSTTKAWKNIYLDSALYIGGYRFLASKTGSGNNNTATGFHTLAANTSGSNNTIAGYSALQNNTIGSSNSAYGSYSLNSNTTGYNNVAIGFMALEKNTSGHNLVAIGDSALFNQTAYDVYENTAVGSSALYSNTNGFSNTALGYRSLHTNTWGYDNIGIGDQSLYLNTSGAFNIAVGNGSLGGNTTGTTNIGIGLSAIYNNGTGEGNTATGSNAMTYSDGGSYNAAYGYEAMEYSTGSYNIGIGYYCLYECSGHSNIAIGNQASNSNLEQSNTIAIGDSALYHSNGPGNIATGSKALYSNTTGSANSSFGTQALYLNTTGANNTAIGYHAGNNVTTGSSNTIIGYGADISDGTLSNATAIGNLAVSGASNRVRIGNGSVTSIGGAVGWTNFSDERIKTNIKQDVPGLAFINLLNPVTYNFDLNKEEQIFKRKDVAEWKEKFDIQKIKFTGFLAQDVEAAAKKINYNFSGVDKPANDKDVYGLRYGDFVVPLVKAVQELSKLNDEKDSAINNLQQQINELKAMIVANQSTVNGQQSTAVTSAFLSQNIPNPFSRSTSISYSIAQKFSSAKIIVTDKNGNALKQINLSNNKGSIVVDAAMLTSGAYQYTLFVDGRTITTKQMEIFK